MAQTPSFKFVPGTILKNNPPSKAPGSRVDAGMRSIAIVAGAIAALSGVGASKLRAAQTTPGVQTLPLAQDFLEAHCVKCHGRDGKVKGELNLVELLAQGELPKRPKVLSKILASVRDQEMPPEEEKQPETAARTAFLKETERLWRVSLESHAQPPRTPVRRMNRFQYHGAVTDLLELKVDVFVLPERILRDQSGYFQPAKHQMPERVQVGNRLMGKSQLIAPRLDGVVPFPQDLKAANGFDTRGDLLTLSPILMESFLELSRSIVQSPDLNPKTSRVWQELCAEPAPGQETRNILRDRLSRFLTRAFRRPVEDETLERYVAFACEAARESGRFADGIKAAVSAALASPQFLYLGDGSTSGKKPERLDPFELASRIAFFLWSSGPDEGLLEAARTGRLQETSVLDAEVDRMLDDPRMKRFCDAFASQWMKLEHLVASDPDRKQFADFFRFGTQSFARRGSVHAMLEPLLLFETVFVENRTIQDFIHSDYTYRSEPLRQFLNFEKEIKPSPENGPSWSEVTFFERLPITSMREGGIITSCAVLTMTSGPAETKPITRGKWVVETIFNDPPPPPPANVPGIEAATGEHKPAQPLSLREKFALHRTRSDCNSCHAKIDPYGFALENYDPVGRWRENDHGARIDPSGKLFNQHPFANVEEFKEALLKEKRRFAKAFTGHLLKYALGREVDPMDQAAVERIVTATEDGGYRLRDMMKEIIRSEPFQTKYNPTEGTLAKQP
ncbi:MAG: hypothetical protein RLZZ244_1134 [Verrucomicrobiota bacterium]|jgi:mono/diheme cytochrome c family protein